MIMPSHGRRLGKRGGTNGKFKLNALERFCA